MHADFLIIGQGIAGTLLSFLLLKEGKSVIVIDRGTKDNASHSGSAVINPFIGKNWTLAKDAGIQVPFALNTFRQMEQLLEIEVLSQKPLLVFHQDEKAAEQFNHRKVWEQSGLLPCPETTIDSLEQTWNIDFGIGSVPGVYTIQASLLLQKWQGYLHEKAQFIEDVFHFGDLVLEKDKIGYKGISADKIIFCEGAAGRHNPFFPEFKFTLNRGDVLLLDIPGLADTALYQKGIRLVPRNDRLFWCGSNYTWKYETLLPDPEWRKEIVQQLRNWLKIPWTIAEHLVSERPTSAGQIPMISRHALQKNTYFLNGLGTRGFSAGPGLAKQMSELLLQ